MSSASPLTGPICFPQPPITKPVSSRPGWRGQLQALLELRKLPQKGPQKRELPCPAPHNLPSEGTSESGLSDESSSPEGDALWVGFERNQLNQPNPELWKRGGVLWSVGWRLTPPHRDGGETGEEGTPQDPGSPALHHHLEEKTPQLPSSAPPSGRKGPSTFVFSFTFLSFSLWTVF